MATTEWTNLDFKEKSGENNVGIGYAPTASTVQYIKKEPDVAFKAVLSELSNLDGHQQKIDEAMDDFDTKMKQWMDQFEGRDLYKEHMTSRKATRATKKSPPPAPQPRTHQFDTCHVSPDVFGSCDQPPSTNQIDYESSFKKMVPRNAELERMVQEMRGHNTKRENDLMKGNALLREQVSTLRTANDACGQTIAEQKELINKLMPKAASYDKLMGKKKKKESTDQLMKSFFGGINRWLHE